MKTESNVISAAMRELAKMIQCDDGVGNMACLEAAERIDEQEADIVKLIKLKGSYRTALHDAIRLPLGVVPASAEGLSLNFDNLECKGRF